MAIPGEFTVMGHRATVQASDPIVVIAASHYHRRPDRTGTEFSPMIQQTETQQSAPVFDKGLANTIVAESEISFIDGAKGILEYVGIGIDELARNSTFEEVVFLLWNRRLPKASELADFIKSIQ